MLFNPIIRFCFIFLSKLQWRSQLNYTPRPHSKWTTRRDSVITWQPPRNNKGRDAERTARTKASNKVAVKRKKVSNKTVPKKKRTKKVKLDDGDGEVVTPNVVDQPPVALKKGKQT